MINVEKKEPASMDELQSFIDELIDKLYQRQSTEEIDFSELIEDLREFKNELSGLDANAYGDGSEKGEELSSAVKRIRWETLKIVISKACSVIIERISDLL